MCPCVVLMLQCVAVEVRWMRAQGPPPWDEIACSNAAGGNLEVQWLRDQNPSQWDETALEEAIDNEELLLL